MKCFQHSEADAVGICANCGRGVCRECAAPIESGRLSCSKGCAEQLTVKLKISDEVNEWAKTTTMDSAKSGKLGSVFLMCFSLLMVGFAAVMYWKHGAEMWPLILFLSLGGAPIFWMGIACWQHAVRQSDVVRHNPWGSRAK